MATFSPNNKSPKKTSSSSPSKRQAPDLSVDSLTDLLLNLGKPKVDEPKTLENTDLPTVRVFLKTFNEYRENGGKKGAEYFIDVSLLETIRHLDLNDIHASMKDVLGYLGELIFFFIFKNLVFYI